MVKRVGNLHKAVQQLGIEGAAASRQDQLHRFFMLHGLLIDPLAHQCVVDIRQGNHLSPDADFVPLEAVGISLSIPPLVMVTADIPAIRVDFAAPQPGNGVQNLTAPDGVFLHDGPLLRRQPAGLLKDIVWNGNLAHIMHDRSVADQLKLFFVKLHLGQPFLHLPQQLHGQAANPLDVLTGFTVPELNHSRQCFNDGAVGFPQLLSLFLQLTGLLFQLLNLFIHNAPQPLTVAVQLNNVCHPLPDHLRHEGLDNKVHRAQSVAPADGHLGVFCCD